jgi:hypothetical protein
MKSSHAPTKTPPTTTIENHVMRRSLEKFGIGLLAAATLLLADDCQAATDDGFTPLFNGRDLSGWVTEHKAGFVARDGMLHCNGAGNYPSWLRSEEIFENFVLRLEYKLDHYGDSGLFLHAPKYGRNSNVGFEVQLSANTRNHKPVASSNMAIFAAVPPKKLAGRVGKWNQLEITFDWPQLKVTLNDEVMQDLDVAKNPELRYRFRTGYLGIQDRGKPIWYRNIRIKTLPSTDTGWQSLCNGRDLSGWTISEKNSAQWEVVGGELVASNGNGYAISGGTYHNFHLQTYLRTSPLANGGIFLRWKSLVPFDRGVEIQIEDIADSIDPTGSIYSYVRANGLSIVPGQWYPLQIFLEDRHCLIRVNGVTVAETDEFPLDRTGNITLQMHRHNSWIRFTDLEVKSLDK